ncbi:MAG: hypothetical protein H6553_12015 [Chitinophagales bacterium]|nr:hypothetical protein [Chitinophagales bacterium]
MKYIYILVFLFGFNFGALAQKNNQYCSQAKDSAKADMLSDTNAIKFYIDGKYNAMNAYLEVKIGNNFYEKNLVKINENKTTPEYRKCYNDAVQKKLDSLYDTNFFANAEKIMKEYDQQGKGYRRAMFPNGDQAMNVFVAKNVKLPNNCKPDDGSDKISVYYYIEVSDIGKVSIVQLVKSNCKAAEQPVADAISKLPEFINATKAGQPQTTNLIIPFVK